MKAAKAGDQSISRDSRPVGAAFSARVLEGLGDPFFPRADQGCNVFQSHAFLAALERHVVKEPDRLILVGVADGSGDPVAVFPFVKRKRFGIPFVEAADYGLVDYFAPTLFRETPLSAAETTLLWRTAVKAVPGVHAVAFKKLPRLLHGKAHALTSAEFLKPMAAAATTLILRDASGAPTIRPERMSLAREVRRKSKKLEQIGPLSFDQATTDAEIDAAMARLVAFRTERFAELGRQDALLDPGVVAFYRELAGNGNAGPPGRLFVLRAGDEVVAVIYSFAFGDAFTLIAPAMSPSRQVQAGSPGLVMLFKALEWSLTQQLRVFDLSVGQLFYKSRFEAETVELFEYQKALSPLGLPIAAELRLRRWIRHLALRHPQVRTTLERIASMGRGGNRQRDAET